ncbi:protein kinase family protein [Actinokineospora bangkokensis]|uniref:Protein kinase domain-containing protein n=1 Tax=Actinokineospora bangkokensis TaxID=1193682 RepID=A0A1Q9LNA7_9PSEU|nr:hypothetical protein [Actinokineospora bangkokensis]OLR93510.1 hypothetical protein BJP25_14495 [Actinokineospora bangkokensis]
MTAPLEFDVAELGRLVALDSGGQGKVYELPEFEQADVLYKEYSPRLVDDVDVEVLRRFAVFPLELPEADRARLLTITSWPQAVVRRDGVVRGFLMRRAPARCTAALRFGGEVSTVLTSAEFLLNHPDYLRELGLAVTDEFRLRFLADTAEALAFLHGLDIAVGDLSPKNLLFSREERPHAHFIDCDAMSLGGQSVLPPVHTPDWVVPQEEEATREGDLYKFGLMVVRVFATDQQSTDTTAVPRRLRKHVVATLGPAPGRVGAQAWRKRLTAARPRTRRVRRFSLPENGTAATVGVGVVVAALIGLFNIVDNDASSGTGSTPGRVVGADTTTRYTLPTYDPNPPLVPLPTYLPSEVYSLPTLDRRLVPTGPAFTCLLVRVVPAPGVTGGEGLDLVRARLGTLLCEAENTPEDLPAFAAPLLEHAPYDSARITGFWGEGTQAPRATLRLSSSSTCWQTTVRFDAENTPTSVGALVAC